MQTLKLQEWIPKTKIWCITFNKKNSRKNAANRKKKDGGWQPWKNKKEKKPRKIKSVNRLKLPT